ncbi:hypothetical protein K9E61_002645 [Staphylococcus pseudintermedius]|nr:hypothetical protein [Staphylococcus pseudintermedius]EGQ2894359.1 hypothetical protein [Staphylococcus pseudintermedius]EHC9927319.1 hypothetical protein [Staphylococcus pseudintermedius]EHT3701714.1 hypothetical protein [Staphylococcus pseudintermedius]EKI4477548.1 hypothetical protein [Staphylococcus pseudintermedius]
MEKSKIYEYLEKFVNPKDEKAGTMEDFNQFKADLYYLGLEGYLNVKYKVDKDMQPQPDGWQITDKGMKFLEEYKS